MNDKDNKMTTDRMRYIEAVRALPSEWITDGLMVSIWNDDVVIAANPEFAPMKYKDDKWQELEFDGMFAKKGVDVNIGTHQNSSQSTNVM